MILVQHLKMKLDMFLDFMVKQLERETPQDQIYKEGQLNFLCVPFLKAKDTQKALNGFHSILIRH